MSNLEIKALELIIAPKRGGQKAFLDTFVFEPENIEEQSLGNLYIIGEITDVSSNSEYLINLLVATIKKEYYSNTNRTPMESMEASLNKTNEMLADFAEQGNIEWIGNLHITAAVSKNASLYFSQTGESKAILVRDKNIIDIGRDIASDPKPHPLKTFSNIASGQIDSGDKLILATSKFLKNISEERVADIIAGSPDDAIEKIKSALGEKSNIALIFLEAKQKNAAGFGFKKIGEDDLGGEGRYSLKYPAKEDRLSEVIKEISLAESQIPISDKIKTAARAIRFIAENVGKILALAWRLAKNLSQIAYAAAKPKLKALAARFSQSANNLQNRAAERLKTSLALAGFLSRLENLKNGAGAKLSGIVPCSAKNIPFKTKLIVLLATGVALLGAYGIVGFEKKKQEEKNIRYYASVLESAQNAAKEAEISRMYQNDDKARESIRLALTNIEKLSKSGYFISETDDLKKKTFEQLDKLESMVRLENPAALVDFAANSRSIKTDGIVWISKKLYAFNSANNAIYKYDFAKKTSEIVAVNSQNIGHLKIAKAIGNTIIFLTDSPGIAVYDPEKPEIKNVPIKFDGGEKEIKDIANFQSVSNLYLLAKSDNGIYKHRLAASGFAKGEKWMKNAEEGAVRDPVSLAIDGSIYLLQNDADEVILKFNKGLKKGFSSPSLLMPLKKAAKILTSETMKNIYILDPENKRAVVISKEGKLIKQYMSDKFDNLKDLAVSPQEKEIYLLNKTSVFEIKI